MPVSLSRVRIATVCLAALLPLGLTACDTMSDALGIGKSSPDEYAVTPQRSLVMPPDYNLRAPQPGATGPADINASGVAARAMATSGQAQPTTTAPPPTIPVQTIEKVPPPSDDKGK